MRKIPKLLFFYASFAGPMVCAESRLTTTLGTDLSPEQSNASLTWEPDYLHNVSDRLKLEFYAALDRPLDPYKNFAVPKATLSLMQRLVNYREVEMGLNLATSVYDLERWNLDGYKVHVFLGGEVSVKINPRLTLQLLAGPKKQWNAHPQRNDGEEQERFGFYERLTALFKLGPFEFEANFRMEQRMTNHWINEYTTYEEVAYPVTNAFSIGVSHELISALVDESTGFYRSFRVFHPRESRVSAFVEIQI